jgi:alpha-L-arabinofuranosidase
MELKINVNKPKFPVSSYLYGAFFEEINNCGDGGLYAEMVQNRAFEDSLVSDGCTVRGSSTGQRSFCPEDDDIPGWSLTGDTAAAPATVAAARMVLDPTKPLNEKRTQSLKVDIIDPDDRGTGVYNCGYWGMFFKKGQAYTLTLHLCGTGGSSVPITVSFENETGQILDAATFTLSGDDWQKHTFMLKPKKTTRAGRLAITTTVPETFWLGFVSLFPQNTWQNRPNGLRTDLAQKIADMKPAFLRFPGGCFGEEFPIVTAFRWKDTIGDITRRGGQWTRWHYRTTNGLGYHEYLQFCEDLGAAPMFVINCGMTCQGREPTLVPLAELDEWVQDALDAIDYANGPVDSVWGRKRAENGRPEAFNMKFVQIGNQKYGPDYEVRYKIFYDAIKRRYPEIQVVSCEYLSNVPLEIVDEHFYADSQFFISETDRYHTYDCNGPKIFVGEYAQTLGTGNLAAALAEAAFLVGIENNQNIVTMTAYASLLANLNRKNWHPNAVYFDNYRSYGTPSYHMFTMFGHHRGSELLPVQLDSPVHYPVISGAAGPGTLNTTAEFKDIRIHKDGKTLWQYKPGRSLLPEQNAGGEWQAADNTLRQTDPRGETAFIKGQTDWTGYTISLKARVTGDDGGLMVVFGDQGARGDQQDYYMWNLNHKDGFCVERQVGWTRHDLGWPIAGKIEKNRWYSIRVELDGAIIRCFLNGKLIHAVSPRPVPEVVATASQDNETGHIIVKMVNTSPNIHLINLRLVGVNEDLLEGTATVLTSKNKADENSLANPQKVAPVERSVQLGSPDFLYTLDRHSVTVLRLKAGKS